MCVLVIDSSKNFWSKVKVNLAQSFLTLFDPRGLYSLWNSPGQKTGVGSLSLLQEHLPNPGIKPRSLALQADSLPADPPGKPKNTGVGSLSLLQGIFPTQESNWGLLHCRHILSWVLITDQRLNLVNWSTFGIVVNTQTGLSPVLMALIIQKGKPVF